MARENSRIQMEIFTLAHFSTENAMALESSLIQLDTSMLEIGSKEFNKVKELKHGLITICFQPNIQGNSKMDTKQAKVNLKCAMEMSTLEIS
jgi:hypothetical protein